MSNAAKTKEFAIFTFVFSADRNGERQIIEESNLGRIRGQILGADGEIVKERSSSRWSRPVWSISLQERCAA